MAKPKSPLLSLGAKGSIGNTLTYQELPGVHILRYTPYPTNVKSPAQIKQRSIYTIACWLWAILTPAQKEAYRSLATRARLNIFSYYMKTQLNGLPLSTLFLPIHTGSGNIAYDDSPNENNGIITGAGWRQGTRKPNLYFDGLNDGVDLGDPAGGEFDFISSWDFTVICTPILGSIGQLVSKRSGINAAWYINVQINGEVWAGFYNGAWRNVGTVGTPLTDGELVIIRSTWDGSRLRIYFDGVLIVTSADFSATPPLANNLNAFVGRDVLGAHYKGNIHAVIFA